MYTPANIAFIAFRASSRVICLRSHFHDGKAHLCPSDPPRAGSRLRYSRDGLRVADLVAAQQARGCGEGDETDPPADIVQPRTTDWSPGTAAAARAARSGE